MNTTSPYSSRLIPHFNETTSLPELVKMTDKGCLFYHGHSHLGSYEILIKSMEGFKDVGVTHFYFELEQEHMQNALTKHFESKGKDTKDLDFSFQLYKNYEWMGWIRHVIDKAHQVGIRVLAVDSHDDNELPPVHDQKAVEHFLNSRISQDTSIARRIKEQTKLLKEDQKFIGLFGSAHVSISLNLNVPSIYFHASQMEPNQELKHCLPSNVKTTSEKTDQLIQQFTIFTSIPFYYDDELDLSQETTSVSIKYLNQLLEALDLKMRFKAYARKKSGRIDAIFETKDPEDWNKISGTLKTYGKNLVVLAPDHYRIMMTNIDQEKIFEQLIQDNVHIKLSKLKK